MLLDDSWCVVKLKVQACDPETLLLDWKIQPVNTKTKNQQIRKTCCSHFSLFNEIKFATDTKIHSSSEPKVRLFPYIK